ncbi:MAG: hypothetical protein Q7R94_02505 [bacterium]|nr:hypothetical protein [bacterium]
MRLGKISSFAAAVVALLVSVFAAPRAAHAQWHSWAQWQRYGATVNTALSQNGFHTGMKAKKWVTLVIYSASQTAMMLPETKPNMYEWYPDPYVYKFPASHAPDQWQPGQIIQMRWHNKPHTAIFICLYQDPYQNGMYWIDCNWGRPRNNGIVQYHFVSFADFEANVGACYSVYEIH